MEITFALIATIGTLVSLIVSVLINLFADKIFVRKSKIKIGGIEFQLSESADESTRKILDKVQELQESPQVFLSYSFQDREFAQRLATDLRKEGVNVWLADEQVKVGDKIIDTIREGISSSQWIIVILSENSSQSDFIGKELSYALEEEEKRNRPFILPALIGDTNLPTELQDKQYADFREEYHSGLERLLYRLKPSNKMSRSRFAEAQQWVSWNKWINKGDNVGLMELKAHGELAPALRVAIKAELERLQKKQQVESKSSDFESEYIQQLKELINLEAG